MGKRLDLHEVLCGVIGTRNVYFQPPSTVQMQYPCIVYDRTKINTKFADDRPYLHTKQYTVTLIDRNPDSAFPDFLAELPRCAHDRQFQADRLYHDVFTINY